MTIVLIGFMAAGKTSVGRALAERLGVPLYDTDEEIARRMGTNNAGEALRRYGEACFRDVEAKVCAHFSGMRGVIATGGGVVEREENIAVLRQDAVFVWLSVSYAEARRRAVRADVERPLLRDDEEASERFARRQSAYRWAADIVIETDGKDVARVVQEIICSVVERHTGKAKSVFSLIGYPVSHSLSPQMHQAGYVALGLDHVCMYDKKDVPDEKVLPERLEALRLGDMQGLSCTAPWKETVAHLCDEVRDAARAIGAVNTLFFRSENIIGENTDYVGVVESLKKCLPLPGAKVAVLGAGGAARAAVYGLAREGSEVTVFARDGGRGRGVARSFVCAWKPWEETDDLLGFDAIINATPIGMGSEEGISPVPREALVPGQIVFDLVYHPVETSLLSFAREKQATPVSGLEMLLEQGVKQFELFTGLPAPREVMRAALPFSPSHEAL